MAEARLPDPGGGGPAGVAARSGAAGSGGGGAAPLVPPPVAAFLEQDPAAALLDPARGLVPAPGRVPQVAVVARDVPSLRDVPCPAGLRARAVGLFLREGTAAPAVVPRPEWPTLRTLRSRRALHGWWTVLRFAAPVDVAAVLAEIVVQSTWGDAVWTVGDDRAIGGADVTSMPPDPRVLNPIGFVTDAPRPVVALPDLDLRAGVTPALVASLRSAQGVRVERWDVDAAADPAAVAASATASTTTARTAAVVEALCLAGVPVTAPPPPAGALPPHLPTVLAAEVDLADPLAREEHSVLLRRAAYDAVVARAPGGGWEQPSVSILLATRRADMLDFALAQVARQRGVAQLELVVAPHGFAVDARAVQDAVGPDIAVQVLAQDAATLFGTVLDRAARAASGRVVLKMDDDDWYAPDVVADLLRARGYSGAEMVGMPAELHYLTEQDLTVKRGHPTELYARFVAGGTMLLDAAVLRAVGGFRPVKKFVDAQLISSVLAAGGAVYRTHGLGYVLRRNPSGHTWQVDLDYLLDPTRTVATWPGFRPSRLLEADPRHRP